MSKQIVLVSNEGKREAISYEEAKVSKFLVSMMEDFGEDSEEVVPLPNFNNRQLDMLVSYMRKYAVEPYKEIERQAIKPGLDKYISDGFYLGLIDKSIGSMYDLYLLNDYMDLEGVSTLLSLKAAEAMILIYENGKDKYSVTELQGQYDDFIKKLVVPETVVGKLFKE